MIVARAPGRSDSASQNGPGFIRAPASGQELAVLEVGGNVFGMRFDQRFEMPIGIFLIPRIGAVHGQTVAGERVIRLCGHERFE
jgi:hypothetical protein